MLRAGATGAAVVGVASLTGGVAMAATAAPTAAVAPVVPSALSTFPLTAVSLLPGRQLDNQNRTLAYLRYLDPNRLLHTFRLNVNIASSATPCGGWEDPSCQLRGHSMGHYLSALAQGYASTGASDLKSIGTTVVSALATCQAASPAAGYRTGFLSAWPENFIDQIEQGTYVWAPWYTQHKIMAGLLDQYQLCGNTQALTVLQNMAAWVKVRMDRLTYAQQQSELGIEFGGMGDTLAALYQVTGNPDHLATAKVFDHAVVFNPLAAGLDQLAGLHANTQIPKILAAHREYQITGTASYRTIATTFWNAVVRDHTYADGDHSNGEYFQTAGQLSQQLSDTNCESCNAYNMLKLSRSLHLVEPNVGYMDYYENALFNHTIPSQDPNSTYGYNAYYVGLRPGAIKGYSNDYYSFVCCHGTGLESNTKYNDTIYTYNGNTLYVNLFIPSVLTWPGRGITVRQDTTFPTAQSTRLTITGSGPIDLRLRIPFWAVGATIKINGTAWTGAVTPGTFAAISRTWASGDVVDLTLPMALRRDSMPDNANMQAIKYGPLLLTAGYGTTDLNSKMPTLDPSTIRTTSAANTFQATASTGAVTLSPMLNMTGQRYNVYWTISQAAVTDTLRYPFDEVAGTVASDSSGNGRTGYLYGASGYAAGRNGNALSLTGGYLSLPNALLAGVSSFTIASWVRPTSAATWSRLFDIGTSSNASMFLTPLSGSGTTRYAITTSGAGGEQQINGPALASGTWSHVAVTQTGALAILYINGVEAARNTAMTLSPASLGATTQNWIGRSQYADPNLPGLVDDFRVYGRALSAAEISSVYQGAS